MSPLEASTVLLDEPERVRFFNDQWFTPGLLKLLKFSRPDVRARGEAEILLRWWLYRGACPECISSVAQLVEQGLYSFVRDKLLPVRERKAVKTVLEERRLQFPSPSQTEHFFTELLLSYSEAHGIFPLIQMGVAFPIPFRLETLNIKTGEVLDADGQVIKTWTTEAAGLWESAGAFQIRIQAKLGRRIDSLEGGSFALPVAIAEHVKGQISPFAFLATGAIRDGQLAGVSGCEAKAELGQKLGVRLWVQPKDTPAQNAAHGQLVIPPGTPIREVMDLVLRAFGEEGIWELTPSHANDLLRQIQPRESSKRHPLERAISLVEKCLAVLQKNNRFQRQNITRGQLLLAELLNHAGRERDADPLFREILDENAEDWELQGAAGASWVVSLCFQGRLEEAVAEGEKLFEKLESFPEDVKGLEARVKVAGAFGGDALLHKALRLGDAPLAMKSRECLENNLAYARELVSVAANSRETDIDPKVSLGMSISRLAVWYALFEPNRTHEKVDQALRDLPVLDGNVQFLRRTRFLGAFRLLLQNTLPDAIDGNTWDLPSDNAPHYIRATALKYRAAIRAAQGDIEGATQDFAEAFAPLSQDTSPTIRLIAWSIAAQAVLRLPNEQSVTYELHLRENVPYVVHYLSGFDPSRELAGVFASRNWTQDHLVEFQRGFAY